MDTRVKQYFRSQFHRDFPLSPGRFESELARRIGSPSRRKPILNAWRAYQEATGGDLEAVRSFYATVLSHPRERLEGLVYAMHLPFTEFYVRTIPSLLPSEGRVLEVGAFTGALVHLLQEARPELNWHALEGVPEAVMLGRARTGEAVEWHEGWFPARLDLPPMDAVLLLSSLPEGYLGDLPSSLEEAAFLERFDLPRRLRGLEGLLKPGGLLLYGHGPFLGKNPGAVQRILQMLGFAQVELVGEGDYSLVSAVMPEVLQEAWPAPPHDSAPSPGPVALERGLEMPSEGEIKALLEAEAYAEVLARLPQGVQGAMAYLRGRALWALSRYAEADEALALAALPEAEDLRVLCWVEQGDLKRALPRLEALVSRGQRYRLALGKTYLGLGRLSEALRQLYECELPEARVHLQNALERLEERIVKLTREGEWSEASRLVEFAEDLSPELLTRPLLRLGLQAALQQGLWGRAARYAQQLYVLGESQGALGLALAGLKLRGPEA